jgi:hypothetical protein
MTDQPDQSEPQQYIDPAEFARLYMQHFCTAPLPEETVTILSDDPDDSPEVITMTEYRRRQRVMHKYALQALHANADRVALLTDTIAGLQARLVSLVERQERLVDMANRISTHVS